MIQFTQQFGQFETGETVQATDIRFGSTDQATNQPHIDFLTNLGIITVEAKTSKSK